MDELIHKFLIEVKKERDEAGIGPEQIPFLYILKKLKVCIGHLKNQGVVKIGDTMNDKYIEIL